MVSNRHNDRFTCHGDSVYIFERKDCSCCKSQPRQSLVAQFLHSRLVYNLDSKKATLISVPEYTSILACKKAKGSDGISLEPRKLNLTVGLHGWC
jgi:hypothetical protein